MIISAFEVRKEKKKVIVYWYSLGYKCERKVRSSTRKVRQDFLFLKGFLKTEERLRSLCGVLGWLDGAEDFFVGVGVDSGVTSGEWLAREEAELIWTGLSYNACILFFTRPPEFNLVRF